MYISIIYDKLKTLVSDDAARDKVSRAIKADMAFLDWKPSPDSSFFDFKEKTERVVQHFAESGLTRDRYIGAAIKQPTLFVQNADTIISNINNVVEQFSSDGLTRRDYLQAAVDQPGLFHARPGTIISNIDGVVDHFAGDGLTRRDYLQAAVDQPSLFASKSSSIVDKIQQVVDHFAADGLTCKGYLTAVIKQPAILTRQADTVIENTHRVVEHFTRYGLTYRDYLRAATKQPSLFNQRSETLIANIEGVVTHFAGDGLTYRDYLRAATKQPSLFTQKPQTIIQHVNLVADLHSQGVLRLPESSRGPPNEVGSVLPFMVSNPHYFCLADDNFALREIHARVTGRPPSSTVLQTSRSQVEHELAKSLGHSDRDKPVAKVDPDAELGPHARNLLLRALIREGWVKGQLER
jgi:hypothetical protein